jgi:hypothetical protein
MASSQLNTLVPLAKHNPEVADPTRPYWLREGIAPAVRRAFDRIMPRSDRVARIRGATARALAAEQYPIGDDPPPSIQNTANSKRGNTVPAGIVDGDVHFHPKYPRILVISIAVRAGRLLHRDLYAQSHRPLADDHRAGHGVEQRGLTQRWPGVSRG